MNRKEHDEIYSGTDDAVAAMSKFLTRWADKNKRLPGQDKNGIITMFNQKTVGLLMFMFVTKDDLSVELEFDLRALKAEGREYMETITEIIITQLDAAREERQRNNTIIMLPEKNKAEPELNNVANSVKAAFPALPDNGTVH